jgi:hypothetical protein
MKTINLKKIVVGVFLAPSLLLTACSKEDKTTQVARAGRVQAADVSVVNGKKMTNCPLNSAGQLNDTGQVFHENGDSGQFLQRVRDLISGQTNPSFITSISGVENGASGIDLEMNLSVSGNSYGSWIKLFIFQDSDVVNCKGNCKSSYNLAFNNVTNVKVVSTNSGGQYLNVLQASFSDQYGSITVLVYPQNYNGYFRGYVYYANNSEWNKGAPKSGLLGTMKIPSCMISN